VKNGGKKARNREAKRNGQKSESEDTARKGRERKNGTILQKI
jgi:hypothetical protein